MATTKKLTKKKYNEIIKESNEQVKSDYPNADAQVWSDFAQMVLDNEPGLKEFIRANICRGDILSQLTDDISGPNYLD